MLNYCVQNNSSLHSLSMNKECIIRNTLKLKIGVNNVGVYCICKLTALHL